jgi:hypothetical protein
MRSAGHGARMGEMKNEYKIWLESEIGRDHSEDLSAHGKIISTCISRWGVWNGFIWLRIGTTDSLILTHRVQRQANS